MSAELDLAEVEALRLIAEQRVAEGDKRSLHVDAVFLIALIARLRSCKEKLMAAEAERDEAVAEAQRLQHLEKTIEGVIEEVRSAAAGCARRALTTSNREVVLFRTSKASAFNFTADWLEAALAYAEIEHDLTADSGSAASREDL